MPKAEMFVRYEDFVWTWMVIMQEFLTECEFDTVQDWNNKQHPNDIFLYNSDMNIVTDHFSESFTLHMMF